MKHELVWVDSHFEIGFAKKCKLLLSGCRLYTKVITRLPIGNVTSVGLDRFEELMPWENTNASFDCGR